MSTRTVLRSTAVLLLAAGCSGTSGTGVQPVGDVGAGGASAGNTSAGNTSAGSTSAGNLGGGGVGGAIAGPVVAIAQSTVARLQVSAVPDTALHAAVAANNAFAVDLYGQVLTQAHGVNVLMSPISASLVLTMTYAGAQGDTATEMARVLHLDPAAGDAVFAGQDALSQALEARGAAAFEAAGMEHLVTPPTAANYELQVANALWGDEKYVWKPPFLDILAEYYGTGVYKLNLEGNADGSRTTINNWVEAHTDGKIVDLLPVGSIDPLLTRLVLVNAVHLKFPWGFTFDDATPDAFVLADGSHISANFMHATADLAYVDDGQAQVAAVPLANDELSVVIALPHEDVSLADYEAKLSAGAQALAVPKTYAAVALSLPKATFTSATFSLSDALKALGMNSAFSKGAADFHGLCNYSTSQTQIWLGDVLQKATLAMQETGVEAAASTAVIVQAMDAVAGSGPAPAPPVPIPMIVNRPYLVALVDGPTGAVLMLGHIGDPTNTGP